MSINTSSKLFVGAHHDDVNLNEDELDLLVWNEDVYFISPYYASQFENGYFGREVTCEFVMADGGVEKVKEMIKEMNELFKTDKCDLIHSPDVY